MDVVKHDWPWKVTCAWCGATSIESTAINHKDSCPVKKEDDLKQAIKDAFQLSSNAPVGARFNRF